MSAEVSMGLRYVHNTKQRFQFYEFVRDKYTASKLNDTEFAKMAEAQLNYKCTPSQVKQARRDFGLQTNAPQFVGNPSGINGSAMQRIAAIEEFLTRFEPKWRETLRRG
jgi:hypothetical protein